LKSLLRNKGIKHISSILYISEKNGVIDWDNRIIVATARSMIKSSSLDNKFWVEEIDTAVYVLNRTTKRRINETTERVQAWSESHHELWLWGIEESRRFVKGRN
jgi:hypothetical protein